MQVVLLVCINTKQVMILTMYYLELGKAICDGKEEILEKRNLPYL